ncbi:unnamed protein product [Nippostrongylus brasiliensis]|uniref:Gelsolin-like protein 1 (inferred by orthology to a C. elegans protein) n=1 Tax=Nippostrongylus brasiliensis TaxID=27835 RepID=A0A0N4YCX1_NIPBR|nr:unnamed protein product [Nippostrongylus brasiliensis]
MSKEIDFKKIGKKLGLEIWRIKDFKLDPVPENEYGQFYTGDTYIVLSIGTATIKTVEIDQALGGLPVQHREVQFHESALFISYFPHGIRYLSGGYDSGYHHVEFKKESLNLGDVFLLDLGKNIYVWMPPDSGRLERIKGMERAKSMADVERLGAATVHILDNDWNTDVEFWSHFGGLSSASHVAKGKNDDEDYWKETAEKVTLWKYVFSNIQKIRYWCINQSRCRVSDSSGQMKVTKVGQGELKYSQLDSKECTPEERAKAVILGTYYLTERKLPPWTQVTRVLESAEPASFTQWFGEWVDGKSKKAFEPRLYQVSDESGQMVVEEVANFSQESLDGDDVMILDALHTIYVWKYLKMANLPRHQKTSIETLYQGKETPVFKKLFPTWDDNLFQNVRSALGDQHEEVAVQLNIQNVFFSFSLDSEEEDVMMQ